MRKASILAALLLLTPALSHAKTLEDLLVEKGVISKGEAKEAAGNAPAKVYYNGGTRLDFADAGFTAKINTLLQTRYTFSDNDEDVGDRNTSSFDIHKARLSVGGNAMHEEFAYYLNADFSSETSELADGWIQWNGCDWFSVKMGQFKTGVSRQYNESEHMLQFADRSLASDYFDYGRQTGAHFATNLMDGGLELGAGIFNGDSDGEGQNLSGRDTRHLGVVNARYNIMGKGASDGEGDINWTESPAMDIGVAYAHSQSENTFDDVTDQYDADVVNVDVNFKSNGFSVHGEYYVGTAEGDASESEVDVQGFYIQGGYFIKPKTLELAARYSLVDCDDGAAGGVCSGNEHVNNVSASINYHWWKHQMKAQFGYDITSAEPVSTNDNTNSNRWILQLSAYL